MANEYTDAFYDDQVEESLQSARVVLPILFEIIKPKSVIDIGCGLGTWLSVCHDLGVSEIKGVDGSYVNESRLMIPREAFTSVDLPSGVNFNRKFDLAISLEVAEHLSISCAERFISKLTSLSDIVLFSSAIPYQGGTGHVNENWPEFWALLFKNCGYELIDLFRPRIWHDQRIAFWYRQNIFLYMNSSVVESSGFSNMVGPVMPLSAIHPELFIWACMREERQPKSNFTRDRKNLEKLHFAWLNQGCVPSDLPTYGTEYHVDFKGIACIRRIFRRIVG